MTADIKRMRISLGITQKKLSMLSQVSQSMIAKIESDNVMPSYQTMKKLFETLELLNHQDEKKAGNVMTDRVISMKVGETVSKALDIMSSAGFSQLPVFERKHCVGSISESVILEKIKSENDLSGVKGLKLEEVMSDPFPTVGRAMPVSSIIPLLAHNFAILVSEKDKIVGIITKADIINMK